MRRCATSERREANACLTLPIRYPLFGMPARRSCCTARCENVMIPRWFAALGIFYAVCVLLCTNASAQTTLPSYPERAVRIIVPFPAGGATDIVARMVADRLAQGWAKPVIVENVTGAAGATGTALAAKAAPDGHTLLVATGTTMTLLPHLRSNLAFDPV